MASGSEGTRGGDSPRESEVSDKVMPLLSREGALVGPSGSGAGAGTGQSNPRVVTDEVLSTSLKEMEKRMEKMIAMAMRGRKRNRSPSPERGHSEEEVLSAGELDDLLDKDQYRGLRIQGSLGQPPKGRAGGFKP